MKFRGFHDSVRTALVLGAGATYGDDIAFCGKENCRPDHPKPPLDRDFLETLALHGSTLSPQHYKKVLELAKGEFGSIRGVGLEQLFTRIEARAWLETKDVSPARGSSDEERQIALSAAIDRAIQEQTRPIRLAIRDVYSRTCNSAIQNPAKSEFLHGGSWHEKVAGFLKADDCVLTFNYDTLIDHAIRHASHSLWNPKSCRTYGTGATVPSNWRGDSCTTRSEFRLLKLHGSVHFRAASNHAPNHTLELVEEQSENDDPLIVPPTFNKPIERYPAINLIWFIAASKLKVAEAVAVVGYSAPPADYRAHALLATPGCPLRVLIVVNPSEVEAERVVRHFAGRTSSDTMVLLRRWLPDFLEVTLG